MPVAAELQRSGAAGISRRPASSSGEETFFRGIRKLLPGHTLTLVARTAGSGRGATGTLPTSSTEPRAGLEDACATRCAAASRTAVRSHLMSDVPLGLFLSGGIDSSGAGRADGAAWCSEPDPHVRGGLRRRRGNELPYARLVAGAVGAEHREVVVSPDEFFGALPRLIWHEDEPIAFPSSVPLYFVSRLAARHVKVVLTGEGADELFLGYNWYRLTAWNERLGALVRALAPRRCGGASGSRRCAARAASPLCAPQLPGARSRHPERCSSRTSRCSRTRCSGGLLCGPGLLERRDPYAASAAVLRRGAGRLARSRMSHADLQTYLVELLMKQDQMSMAASIESRVPFLDHDLVEHVARCRVRFKVRGWQTKAVLRAAVAGSCAAGDSHAAARWDFRCRSAGGCAGSSASVVDEFVLGAARPCPRVVRADARRRLVAEHAAGARSTAIDSGCW